MKIYPIKLALTIISSVSLISSLPGKVVAITKPPLEITTSTTRIAQTTQKTDLDLLAKAITNFLQSSSYLTESKSFLTAKVSGMDVKLEINTKNIIQSDGKFRSEITLMAGEFTQSTALVISDSKQVWIYRPDLNKYSVSSYASFQNNYQESFFMGISSLMFLQFPEAARKEVSNNGINEQLLQDLGLTNSQNLRQETTTVEGEELSVYIHEDKKEKMTISGFIQPQTGNLKQMELSGESDGVDILITEKILQRTADPVIDDQTFTFTPPTGVEKVKSLSISPF